MNRHLAIFCLSLIGLLGNVVILYSTLAERMFELRGYVDASRDFNLPYRVPRLGVNAELTQYSLIELEQQLDLMESSNIVWVRQIVRWSEIETVASQFQWDVWDQVFYTIKQHPNLRVIAVLNTTPVWARALNLSATAPPIEPAMFGEFSRVFANRYGEIIDYYQIWDEPNLQMGWGGRNPSPAAYTALLADAHKAIHDVDSKATVIAAALAPTIETGPQNISDWYFLRDMYAVGAKDHMDAVAAKPYGFNTSSNDRDVILDKLNFSRVVLLREEMVRQGDAKKAIWFSNWGWNSLPAAWKGKPSIWGSATSDNQVDFTLTALGRVEREWPWVAGITLQHWQPDVSSTDPVWGFSLINQQGQPTPLLRALEQYEPPQYAQNGLFPAVNPFARYSGVWTFGELGADIGWVQDSQFEFEFAGADLSLLLRQDNYTAYLYPKVDNQPANATPSDSSGNAYVVLTSASLKAEINLIPIARNLLPQNHTLHVVSDRGWDRWAIAGFGVSAGDLTSPYDRRIYVIYFAIALTILSTITSGYNLNWSQTRRLFGILGQRLSVSIRLPLSVLSSVVLLVGMMLTWGEGMPAIVRREPAPLLLAFVTAGLVKLQPGFIVTVIAAFILFFFIYNQVYIGLVLTIFSAPFFLFPIELYRFSIPLSEVLVLITVTAWCLRLIVGAAHRCRPLAGEPPYPTIIQYAKSLKGIDYAVILWGLIGVISIAWAQYPQQAMSELRVMILEPILFYMIFRTAHLSKRQIQVIIYAFLLAGLTVAVIGLWQYFRGEAIIEAEAGARRLASVYGSPNNVALFLGRCIPFFVAFMVLRGDFRKRLLSLFALIVSIITLLLTQSVGGIFIGVPLSITVVCALALGKSARYALLLLLIVVAVMFTISLRSPRFARVLDFSGGTNFYRLRVWESALNVIHDYPLTGLGLDQFLYVFRSHYIMPDAWQEPNLSHPHNIVLDFWVRLGIMGVVALIWIQAAFWKTALCLRNYYRQSADVASYAIILGVIGSMVNLLGHGLVDNSVYLQDLSYVFVMLLASMAVIQNWQRVSESSI